MARYTDEKRAEAVVLLTAAGYPDKKGSLQSIANKLNIPAMTISRWFKLELNPPPNKIVNEKKAQLTDELETLAYKLVDAMGGKLEGATLQQTATTFGIVVDKWQLLKGNANWRIEVIGLVKDGTLTHEQVKAELGEELARELFDSLSLSTI